MRTHLQELYQKSCVSSTVMQSVNQKSIEQGGDYSKLFHCNAGQCSKVSLSRPILNKLNAEGASNHLSSKFDNNKEKIRGCRITQDKGQKATSPGKQ